MTRRLRRIISLLLCSLVSIGAAADETAGLVWHSSTAEAFALARSEHRFVILDLEAVWCHWCHVMEEQTYANGEVRQLLSEHYVALKIDQDADPAIAARYGDWGWPATIVFAPDGSEIVKRRGFIEPGNMVSMLKAIVADPSPGPSVRDARPVTPAVSSQLPEDVRKQLSVTYQSAYNLKHGGWGEGQRFIDASALELAMVLARDGDPHAEHMARQTLDQNLRLIDPIWGGVYQYAVQADWRAPHFEKIMAFQADDLRLYALAYATWKDPQYLKAAQSIHSYLTHFLLSPEGAFYVSQDADLDAKTDGKKYYALNDSARRKLGQPHIDAHVYARENGWAIAALCQVHDSLGDVQALQEAIRAADWVIANRTLAGGGFSHDAGDKSAPFLADNVAMTQALLSLYRSSGQRMWLTRAEQTLRFIDVQFRASDAGFVSAVASVSASGALAIPLRNVDENTALARTANLAFRVTGNAADRAISESAMRLVAAADTIDARPFLPALILADRELSNDPTHITIVGSKDDPAAQALQVSALRYPTGYLRVDWWDRSEGPLPNPDVTYPNLAKAAAFICTGNACSLPVFQPQLIAAAAERLRGAMSTKQ